MMNRFKTQGLYLSGTGRLLSYDTAKLAKDKGFDPEALSIYYDPPKKGIVVGQSGARKYNYYKDKPKDGIERVHNTIQSVLQQWLREKHQIIVDVSLDFFNSYTKESIKYSPTFYTYSNNKKRFWIYTDYINSDECTKKMQEEMPIFQNYSTYEEALEIGLQEGLKLIK